ncbi:mucin TcMUCII [Trypanosoma cruzi cruzi]|nr:mucin TcMUCII [Trypanosoma cruzi cruzi]
MHKINRRRNIHKVLRIIRHRNHVRRQKCQIRRRQSRRPPAHRHVSAKSTAASAALRGCVSRCCSPHPRWRAPLWAKRERGLCVPALSHGDMCTSTVVRCMK